MIGLDTMAEISIFRRNLMLDERACNPVVVNGVKKGSSPIYISKMGTSVIVYQIHGFFSIEEE